MLFTEVSEPQQHMAAQTMNFHGTKVLGHLFPGASVIMSIPFLNFDEC